MKYKGIELTPITKPQIFDPPKELLVWDNNFQEPRIVLVWCIAPASAKLDYPIRCIGTIHYEICAEIPKTTSKRATNKELAEWCAKGNGQIHCALGFNTHSFYSYQNEDDDSLVTQDVYIRPFGTKEWVEPTLENMGME